VPLDPNDVQANTFVLVDQTYPSLSAGPSGAFVVVWQSFGSAGNDPDNFSIQMRRFASAGAALDANDRQVNTYGRSSQWHPSVSVAPSGDFVVAWQSNGSAGSDTDRDSIQMRRFASDGTALDPSDVQVNTYTTSAQTRPRVSVGPSGDFVVVWDSEGSDGDDTSQSSIQMRTFASDGTPLSPTDVQVNTYTSNQQAFPSVSVGPTGDFVVVWHSFGSASGDTFYQSVQMRRFASDATPLGSGDFQVNTYTTSTQGYPSVSVGPSGDFVVVWHSDGSAGTDNSDSSIQMRRFASNGTPLDLSEFQVNSFAPSYQLLASVSHGPSGDVVVVWRSFQSAGSDTDGSSIQMRRFASDGTALDADDVQVNTYVTTSQANPRVSVGPSGNFAIAWDSYGSAGTDTSFHSIQMRRFGDPSPTVTETPTITATPTPTWTALATSTSTATVRPTLSPTPTQPAGVVLGRSSSQVLVLLGLLLFSTLVAFRRRR
jgi:hypothetical protein